MCPSKVVRTSRSALFSTSRVRQRARPFLASSALSSDRKAMTSSLSPASATSTSWVRNMLSDAKIFAPFSQTSAIVASPPKRKVRDPLPTKVVRYQMSWSCSGVGRSSLQRPAACSACAAVPGTIAGIQSRSRGNASGPLARSGAVKASCQAPIKRTASRVSTAPARSPPRSARTGERRYRTCDD